MKTSKIFSTAFRALLRNKTRAVLTILGIVIGIGAVIAMMEIGQGSAKAIAQTIASMGANTLLVVPGNAASGGISMGSGSVQTLTPGDATALSENYLPFKAVAPLVKGKGQVVFGNRNWVPMNINGTTPDYLEVRDWTELAQGEVFSERDVRNANKVCLIGQTLVRELFQGESPIGQEVRVQNVSFKVIGVLASKGANMMGADQDDVLLAPWTTIKFRSGSGAATSTAAASTTTNTVSNLYPNAKTELYPEISTTQSQNSPSPTRFITIDQILISATSAEAIPEGIEGIVSILRQRHGLRPGEPEDFNVRNMTEMTNALTSTSTMMTRLLLTVALISLLVGGVGIMNIMLVSVTERTREIGLRMAVGAKQQDILRQFLVEALVLCLTGGVIGILLGKGISAVVKIVLHWPTASSLLAVIAAVAVSATVGVLFGYYPAWKASRLDPIEALRYE